MALVLAPTSFLQLGRIMIGLFLGLVLGVALAMITTSFAHADALHGRGRGSGGDRNWNSHSGGARHYWHQSHYGQPGVIYAPPVVYSAPPQYEAPGLNLIVPLSIR